MTPEEEAAAAAAGTTPEEKADAEFETSIADLPEEEKTAKRTERQQQFTDKDLDAEIAAEEERKRLAGEAFRERDKKRKERDAAIAAGEVEDKPLTTADLESITATATEAATKIASESLARAVARTLAASDKEAQLIFLKWQNRTFPPGMSLQDQVEEAFVVTNSKRLIGQRNEALRALRNRDGASDGTAVTHRNGAPSGEPKLADSDRTALLAAGFAWDGAKRLYKKPLTSGGFLYQDPKTKRTFRGV